MIKFVAGVRVVNHRGGNYVRKFRLAFAAAGVLVIAAAGLALATTTGTSGTKSSRLHVTKLAPAVATSPDQA